jgi:hypothetical protein
MGNYTSFFGFQYSANMGKSQANSMQDEPSQKVAPQRGRFAETPSWQPRFRDPSAIVGKRGPDIWFLASATNFKKKPLLRGAFFTNHIAT